jgi:CRP-like cAMP-binding protein
MIKRQQSTKLAFQNRVTSDDAPNYLHMGISRESLERSTRDFRLLGQVSEKKKKDLAT